MSKLISPTNQVERQSVDLAEPDQINAVPPLRDESNIKAQKTKAIAFAGQPLAHLLAVPKLGKKLGLRTFRPK